MALMQSGVLDALSKLKARPGYLTSVSGGSIIGSYYTCGYDPAYFPLVKRGALRVKPRLRNLFTVLRLASPPQVWGYRVPWTLTRIDLLARTLDESYLSGKVFQQLPTSAPNLPYRHHGT